MGEVEEGEASAGGAEAGALAPLRQQQQLPTAVGSKGEGEGEGAGEGAGKVTRQQQEAEALLLLIAPPPGQGVEVEDVQQLQYAGAEAAMGAARRVVASRRHVPALAVRRAAGEGGRAAKQQEAEEAGEEGVAARAACPSASLPCIPALTVLYCPHYHAGPEAVRPEVGVGQQQLGEAVVVAAAELGSPGPLVSKQAAGTAVYLHFPSFVPAVSFHPSPPSLTNPFRRQHGRVLRLPAGWPLEPVSDRAGGSKGGGSRGSKGWVEVGIGTLTHCSGC